MKQFNPELREEFSQHLDEVEQNDKILHVVITGMGERAFSAGAALKLRAKEKQESDVRPAHLGQLAAET